MSLQSTFLAELQEISRSIKKEEGEKIQTEILRVMALLKEKAKEGNKHNIDCHYSEHVANQLRAEGLKVEICGSHDYDGKYSVIEVSWTY